MKQVPETKIKLTELKELYNKGYNLLGELREDGGAPVVRANFFYERHHCYLRRVKSWF